MKPGLKTALDFIECFMWGVCPFLAILMGILLIGRYLETILLALLIGIACFLVALLGSDMRDWWRAT